MARPQRNQPPDDEVAHALAEVYRILVRVGRVAREQDADSGRPTEQQLKPEAGDIGEGVND